MRWFESLAYSIADIVTGCALVGSVYLFYLSTQMNSIQAPTVAALGIGALVFSHVFATAVHRHIEQQRQARERDEL